MIRGLAMWAVWIVACASAPGQEFLMLRSEYAHGNGRFGRSVAVEGDWLAVASHEFVAAVSGVGHVALFRRAATGEWQRDQLLRPSFAPSNTIWRPEAIRLRQGRLIAAGARIMVWEWDGSTWREDAFLGTAEQQALWGTEYQYVASDGDTILATISGVPDAHVFFWERRGPGVWEKVLTVRASEYGGVTPGVNDPTAFGLGLHVDGDVAVIGQPVYGPSVRGRAHVYRRVQGTWQFEETLDPPSSFGTNQVHGYAIAGQGDVLFVSSVGDSVALPDDHVGSVYEYRHAPGLGWQVVSRLRLTAELGQNVSPAGFGSELVYAPPRLAVGAGDLRGAGSLPGAPTTGRGTVFVFERCGDLWNQIKVMETPLAWGLWGLGGRRRLDFDGVTVVSSNPEVGYPHPSGAYWVSRAGLVAVTSIPAAVPNPPCLEIGQPFCAPSAGGPTCGCGAVASPGRGCPNSVGAGARLHCHGAFDQAQVDRVLVEGLPAGAITLLQVGGPTPQPLPAQAAGSGVTCVGTVFGRRVGQADGQGLVRFDAVAAPPPQVLYAAWLEPFPLEAAYRDPQDSCGNGWNTSNGVLFSGGI